MKKTIISRLVLTLIATFALHFTAFSQSIVLSELPGGNGISKTYISSEMINLNPESISGMVKNQASMFEKIDGIEIYECENPQMCKEAEKMIDKFFEKYKKVNLMYISDEVESTSTFLLYDKKKKNDAIGYGVYVQEKNELTLIFIRGRIKAKTD